MCCIADLEPAAPDRSHLHFCPTCRETWECDCSHSEIEDLTCNPCDEVEADGLEIAA